MGYKNTWVADGLQCLAEFDNWRDKIDWTLNMQKEYGNYPVTHDWMTREEKLEALQKRMDETDWTVVMHYVKYFGSALVDLPDHAPDLWKRRPWDYVSPYWGDWSRCDNCDRTFEVGETGDAGGDRDLCERCLEPEERCRVCGGTDGLHRIPGCNGESIDA